MAGRGLAHLLWTHLLLATIMACSATQPVRVLSRGERRFISSLGGPLLPHHVPTTGFVPYANVGTMWGARDNLTLSANLHLLAAAFGVAGADVGAARRLRRQDGLIPEVTGQAQLYGFAGTGGVRASPNLTATASWSPGPRALLYGRSALTITSLPKPTGHPASGS
jgi:hypothetical protein